MFKAILFLIIGAGTMYLYLNPNDVDGLVDTARKAAHDTGSFIVENTK